MSDINKIVAAILTAGRVPTMKHDDAPRSMEDWLAEYHAWVEVLGKQDSSGSYSRRKAYMDAFLGKDDPPGT
jgi:hypothetical protein